MTVRKNKKRKQSDGDTNPSSDDEWPLGDGKDSVDAAGQERERAVIIRSSSELSPSKIANTVSSLHVDSGHDDKIRDRDENEKGNNAESLSRDPSNAEAGVICGICFSEGQEPHRGKLDCCSHFFCFVCIMEWAKVESRCPLCKQRFVTIVKAPTAEQSRGRMIRIPTRNQVYVPSEEDRSIEPYANTVCMECLESGTEALLLLCDGCDSAAHTYCIGLGNSVPRGDWYCQACKSVFVDEASSSSSDDSYDSASSHDEGNMEGELSGDSLPDRSSLAQASRVFPRRSRLMRRAASASGSQLRRSGRGRRRTTDRILHAHVVTIEDAVQEPMPPSRLLPTGRTGNAHVVARGFTVPMPPSRSLPSSSTNARTLTRQRQLQDRIQCMRENWNNIRSGSVEFGEAQHYPVISLGAAPLKSSSSLPLDASHSAHETMSTSSGLSKEGILKGSSTQIKLKSDVDKAWSMLEKAKALKETGTTKQRRTGEPNIKHHERNPRGQSSADSFSCQSSNSLISMEKHISLNRFRKDYEKSSSFGGSSSVGRPEARPPVKAVSPLSNYTKDMTTLQKHVFLGNAGRWDLNRKNLVGDTHVNESDIKGKVSIPMNEQVRSLNSCRETVQGTSLVDFEWTVSDMETEDVSFYPKKSELEGNIKNGHLDVLNNRRNFCGSISQVNDPSIERHDVNSRHGVPKCNRKTVSCSGVSAVNTGPCPFDDLSTQSFDDKKDYSKLVYIEKKSLGNLIEYQQRIKHTKLINGPSKLFSNSGMPDAQSNDLNCVPSGSQNLSEAKSLQLSSEASVHCNELGRDVPYSQGHLVVHSRSKHQWMAKPCLKVKNSPSKIGEESPQREAVKDLVLKSISQILNPLLKSKRIGKERYKELARSTTHNVFAAYGLDHSKKLVQSVEAIFCSHTSADVSGNVVDRLCNQCLHERVTRVLGTLIDRIEAPLMRH